MVDLIPDLGTSICCIREESKEREVSFTELANIIVEASKYKVSMAGWQAGNTEKSCSWSLKAGC